MAQQRKILVVDDDSELRDMLVEQLSLDAEFEAQGVDTAAKGLAAAKAAQTDLLLMDISLRDLVGRDAV
jgi:DNA-binding response OmpR family regulator